MDHITKHDESTTPDGDVKWREESHTGEGIYRRLVMATPWELERTNCYCCTCYEDYYSGMVSTDGYCRNHGMGFGTRPCDVHDLPGEPIDLRELEPDFIGPEPMPESVLTVRAKQVKKRNILQ